MQQALGLSDRHRRLRSVSEPPTPSLATGYGQESETLDFIEGGLVYRLPWAMEAVRVRAEANGDVVGDNGLALD